MKLSVSLSAADVAFLDDYARTHEGSTRSAALQAAVRALRDEELAEQYRQAAQEWRDSGEGEVWDIATADGVGGSGAR